MKKLLNIFLIIVMILSIAIPSTISAASKLAKSKISSVTASSSTSIKIKWKKVSGADGYVIYQKAGSGSYKKIKTVTSGKITSYTKKSLLSGKKYTYKIRAYDKSGSKKIYSAYSSTKSAYTKPAKAKITSVSAASSSSIKVKWKKVSGADGYEIYRKTGSGSYKKIKTATSGKTTSYTNKKLSANKKYTYKIKAYIKSGSKKIYGSFSAVKSAKTKCSHKYKQGICTICKAKDTNKYTHDTTETTSSEPHNTTEATSSESPQATSSVNPNYEICPNRSNDLPHRWSDATCTAPKVCDFCEKEYSEPLGHTISKDGICKTCGQSITPLIVECNNPLTFDGVAMNYINYNYNTENKRITFYFDLVSSDNANIREFFVKMTLYNGNTKLTSKTVGLLDPNLYTDILASTLTNETTKIVLENLS